MVIGSASDRGAAALVALRWGDRAWADELMGRLRAPLLDALATAPMLPPTLVRAAVAGEDAEALAALGRNQTPTPAAALAIATLGSPALGVRLYLAEFPFGSDVLGRFGPATQPEPVGDRARAQARRTEIRRAVANALPLRGAVLAAADPADPRWRRPGGLVERVLETRADDRLIPALRGPFPELIGHALRVLGVDLPRPVLLDAARRLLESDGESFDAFVRAARMHADFGHADLAGRWHEAAATALPVDDATFADHLLLLGLRHLDKRVPRGECKYTDDQDEDWNADFAVYALHAFAKVTADVPLWDLVRAEHARRPFTGPGLAALTRRPDCPADLAAQAYAEEPYRVLSLAPRVPLAWITALRSDRSSGMVVGPALSRGLAEGRFDPAEVLATVSPAVDVFAHLPLDAPGVREAVTGLAARLGASPGPWEAIIHERAWLFGTARQLVDSALTGRMPEHHPVTFARTPHAANRVEAVFQTLFACAGPEAQDALIPSLPERHLELLCMPGVVTEAVRAEILARRGSAAAVAMATFAAGLSPAETAALLDRDEPEVNTLLYARAPLTLEQRVRLTSGTDRHGRPRAVPVSEQVAAWGGRHTSPAEHHDRVAAARQSGHPLVLRHFPWRLAGRTAGPQLAMLVRLWEYGGPDDVRELLGCATTPRCGHPACPWPAGTQAVVRRALAAGPAAGLDLLRRAAEEAVRPEVLIAELRVANPRVEHPVHPGPLPWPEILRAQAERSFDADVISFLLAKPDCPAEFYRAALRSPAVFQARAPATWVAQGLARGVITVLDVAGACTPAALAFRAVTTHARQSRHFLRTPQARELIRRVRTRLDNPDAWVVAVHLLPDFPGTLLELVDIAAASGSSEPRRRP
ncbi:hypothetical protein ACIBSV_10190 [Embleya sp. NPDC050154]|uniref:hypothetical protein n=1 Tax=Embleya sp. NPDC050154 TaxID=3363988 RepID=UPI0037A7F978